MGKKYTIYDLVELAQVWHELPMTKEQRDHKLRTAGYDPEKIEKAIGNLQTKVRNQGGN